LTSIILGGVYQKLEAMYVFYTHDEQSAWQNWVADNNNLYGVNGDLYFLPFWGFKGNGLPSGPALSMVDNLNDVVDSSNFSTMVRVAGGVMGSNYSFGVANSSITNSWFISLERTTTQISYVNGSIVSGTLQPTPYVSSIIRDGNSVKLYKNASTQIATDSDAPVTLPAYPLYILGRNNKGTNEGSFIGILEFFAIGENLTLADHVIINNAYNAYKNEIDNAF
jgi:hypothetical protein